MNHLVFLLFQGCYTAFYKLIQENINILIGIAAGIGIAMVRNLFSYTYILIFLPAKCKGKVTFMYFIF